VASISWNYRAQDYIIKVWLVFVFLILFFKVDVWDVVDEGVCKSTTGKSTKGLKLAADSPSNVPVQPSVWTKKIDH
jgi:hypothetical protein